MGNHDIPNPEGFLKVTSDGIRSGSEGTRTFKIETVSGDIDLDD